jgi:hypothetical protein
METETYRPARLILLGEDASPSFAGRHRSIRWSRLSHHRFSSGTPQRTPTSPPSTPTASSRPSRPAVFPTPCTCSPTARTALAWPKTLARQRSGPRWRTLGSTSPPVRRQR